MRSNQMCGLVIGLEVSMQLQSSTKEVSRIYKLNPLSCGYGKESVCLN